MKSVEKPSSAGSSRACWMVARSIPVAVGYAPRSPAWRMASILSPVSRSHRAQSRKASRIRPCVSENTAIFIAASLHAQVPRLLQVFTRIGLEGHHRLCAADGLERDHALGDDGGQILILWQAQDGDQVQVARHEIDFRH